MQPIENFIGYFFKSLNGAEGVVKYWKEHAGNPSLKQSNCFWGGLKMIANAKASGKSLENRYCNHDSLWKTVHPEDTVKALFQTGLHKSRP